MNRWAALALLLAVAGALALRLPQLSARPLHNDEGVNAIKLAALWEKGEYRYDPHEFHGPSLYYFSLPFLWLSPTRDAADLDATRLRFVTVWFGVGLILLLPLLADGLGKTAVVLAAMFVAFSPAMAFYSRYFIHEMLLVFFTLLTLGAGWRFAGTKKKLWAVLAGIGFGFMFTTKETFVLSAIAAVLATVATVWWNYWRARRTGGPNAEAAHGQCSVQSLLHTVTQNRKALALAAFSAFAVWLVLFSSFFTNWSGPVDSIRTYFPWLSRAGGNSPHIHSWYFYFDRLFFWRIGAASNWGERWILALALVGMVAAFGSNRAIVGSPTLARFLVFYTLLLAVIYSAISYKTPWCLVNFWIGIVLLAGVGASAVWQFSRSKIFRTVYLIALAAGALELTELAKLASQDYAGHRKNPYVYAQTTTNLLALVERVEAVARFAPDGDETVVKIISPDSYGPLPWFLRRLKNTGWWEQLPNDPYAPIIIASAKLGARLDEKSDSAYVMTGMYEMHPGSFLELYVERPLWEKFVETLPRNREE